MARRRSESKFGPERLTVLIRDARTMWEKLYWNVDQLRDAIFDGDERQRVVFATIDVCIASWSLEKWIEREAKRGAEKNGLPVLFNGNIPERLVLNSIANTAKHAGYRDESGQEVEIRLIYRSPNEHMLGGYEVKLSNSVGEIDLYQIAHQLPNQWWDVLLALGKVSGPKPTPEWARNKLARAFPNPPSDFPTR